jgi:asparagine synthase (glutamine-hydrolysing)
MPPALLATPIFGAIARTAEARILLSPENLARMVEPGGDSGRLDWWIERDVGLAALRPEAVVRSPADAAAAAVLCIRGNVRAPGRSEPPRGWHLAPAATGTEAVLYDLLERENAAIAELRGHFVLAVWDGMSRRLLLARDQLGQRSMFIHAAKEFYWFCSELAPLLRLPGTTAEIDFESSFWYLAMGMASPGRTLHARVSRLPAAHIAEWRPGGAVMERRYWTPLDPQSPITASPPVIGRLRERLDAAVVEQLGGSAGPIGMLLSGGVDSTYLAATLRGLPGIELQSYTARFEDGLQANEHEYAVAVADWLGIPHRTVPLLAEQAAEILEQVVLASAEPCGAWATMSHFAILARAHQDDVSQLVFGLGADEIFGGYDHHRLYYARLLRYLRRHPPPPGVEGLESVLAPETQAARRTLYPGIARFFDDAALRAFLLPPFNSWHYASHLRQFYRECRRLKPEAHAIEMMIAHECQFRVPDLLMANFEPLSRRMGITTAYPFLCPDLVRLVSGLGPESRYRTRAGRFSIDRARLEPGFKWAMMELARDRVPGAILNRPRKSYTAPFAAWMRTASFGRPTIARLRRSRFWDLGFVRRSSLDEILGALEAGPGPNAFRLWALVTLAGWFDRFVDQPAAAIGRPSEGACAQPTHPIGSMPSASGSR